MNYSRGFRIRNIRIFSKENLKRIKEIRKNKIGIILINASKKN
jgi:hypothetical protein